MVEYFKFQKTTYRVFNEIASKSVLLTSYSSKISVFVVYLIGSREKGFILVSNCNISFLAVE